MALDRWSRLQSSQFGTSSSLRNDGRGGSTGSQLRRLNEDYNQAQRLLRRQARRGDANSALAAIKLREDALAQGIQTGGIRRKEEYDAGILGRVQAMEQGAADRESAVAANRTMAEEALAGDTPTLAPEAAGPPAPDRNTAALDILEGVKMEDDTMAQRGLDAASRLGVSNPTSVLRGDPNLRYRKTLDSALSAAKSPAEIEALRKRGIRYGVTAADFDRRANWWERNRKL